MVAVETVRHSDYVPQLATLFNTVFHKEWSLELWRWKHLSNPLNEPDPSVVVALDGGMVVGARPLMRVNLRYQGFLLRAVVPCDTMVHPEYRRHGLFSRMNELAIHNERAKGTALFFNFPNRISGAGYLNQGWSEVAMLQDLVLVINPNKVASTVLESDLISSVGATIYRALLGARAFRNRLPAGEVTTVAYDEYSDIPSGVPMLYDPDRIELVRDPEFMRWRLDANPLEESYHLAAFAGGERAGYMGLAISERLKGLKQGWLLDCLVKGYDIRVFSSLITTAVDLLRGLGCDYIRAWGIQRPDFAAFLTRKMGFWAVPLPLLGRAAGDRLPRLVAKATASEPLGDLKSFAISNWNLTPLFRDPT